MQADVEEAIQELEAGSLRILTVHDSVRAVAQLPHARNAAHGRRETESDGTGASNLGWEAGSVGHLERPGGGKLRPKRCARPEACRYSAVGRGDLSAAGQEYG